MATVFLGLAFSNNSLVFAKERGGKLEGREFAPASIMLAHRESWESFYKENPKIFSTYDRFGKILASS